MVLDFILRWYPCATVVIECVRFRVLPHSLFSHIFYALTAATTCQQGHLFYVNLGTDFEIYIPLIGRCDILLGKSLLFFVNNDQQISFSCLPAVYSCIMSAFVNLLSRLEAKVHEMPLLFATFATIIYWMVLLYYRGQTRKVITMAFFLGTAT